MIYVTIEELSLRQLFTHLVSSPLEQASTLFTRSFNPLLLINELSKSYTASRNPRITKMYLVSSNFRNRKIPSHDSSIAVYDIPKLSWENCLRSPITSRLGCRRIAVNPLQVNKPRRQPTEAGHDYQADQEATVMNGGFHRLSRSTNDGVAPRRRADDCCWTGAPLVAVGAGSRGILFTASKGILRRSEDI